jgi:pimeloyl-ACP methyl ester carboxylesterase
MRATRSFASLFLAAALSVTAVATASAAAASPRGTGLYCPDSDTYQVATCDVAAAMPSTPVGAQLEWLLPHLADGGATLTTDEVIRHTHPDLLQFLPAEQFVGAVRSTTEELGELRFVGFNYPPRPEQAVAVVQGDDGVRGAVAMGVDPATGLVDTLEITLAPPTIVPSGPHSGWFDVGGRDVFLRCTGEGSPTVIFENGLTADWYDLQNSVSSTTRACSYDPALQNGPFSRSDPAPTPRDDKARVRDMSRLFHAARLEGPYVLVGHSNGGLFSLAYASRHPHQVAGMVLIDPVHPSYHNRKLEMLRGELDPATWQAVADSSCAILPKVLDAEQLDICSSEEHVRKILRHHPLRPMPLSVISHGIPMSYPPGWPADAEENLWRQLQDEIAALVPGSRHIVAEESDHDIQHQQPELVLAEIHTVVDAVRSGATTAQ